MKDNNLLFADYKKEKAFNGILAIEPELWQDYFFQHTLTDDNDKPNRDNREGELKKEFKWLNWHSESWMIWEVSNLHKIPLKQRLKFIDKFTEDYKGYFSLWASSMASWWVHFHVFSKLERDKSLPIFNNISIENINNNLYNTLLYWVINDNKFYSRAVYWKQSFSKGQLLPQGSRNHIACSKMDFLPWIEFRANNVFDIRLYWYYIAISLLWILKIDLMSPIKDTKIKASIVNWIRDKKKIEDADEFGRIHSKDFKHLINFKDKKSFSMVILKQNLWKMLFILTINQLPKARESLEEYIKEILDIEIDAIPFDFTTNSITKAKDWYTIILWWVVTFFRNKKTIRSILLTFWNTLISTMFSWWLSSVTSTLKKVNLINK